MFISIKLKKLHYALSDYQQAAEVASDDDGCGKNFVIKTTSYHVVNVIIHFPTTGMYTF